MIKKRFWIGVKAIAIVTIALLLITGATITNSKRNKVEAFGFNENIESYVLLFLTIKTDNMFNIKGLR